MSFDEKVVVTVRDLIDRMATSQVGQPFLISPETGRVLTYDGLQRQLLYISRYFHELGLSPGDKIALLTDNGLSAIQLFLGAMYSGLVCVPLNVRAGLSHLSFMLNDCDTNVMFVGDDYGELSERALAEVRRPIKVVAADVDGLPQVADISSVSDALTPISPEHPAMLIYSSGSTGLPKGAVHTHRSLLAHGRNAARSHELTAADRSLLVLPLYHINAECVTLMPTLTSGGSVVVPHGFLVNEFWNWLDDYRCTWSAVVPTIISQLLDWQDPRAHERTGMFQRVRFLRTSSAPLSPALHREFADKFNLVLIQAMGSSEAGNVFSNPLPPRKNKIGSPGLPWGFETKIVGRDNAEVQAGEPGEVLLRGDGMMQGYHNDPDGTQAALDTDGWLHTGDLAYQDEDGYFFVVGRSKELLIKGGMNIAPKQIDEVLEAHPAVLEAAAVGIPDRYVGEDVVAFAVLRDKMRCSERELLDFCEGRLGHFKTPTHIYFAKDLPKGPSGKVQRLRLTEDAERLGDARSKSTVVAPDAQSSQFATDPEVEKVIGEIWSELLGEAPIEPTANFFALGGYSLLAVQTFSRLRSKVPVVLSLSDFFENPTIRQQAALVQQRVAAFRARETAQNNFDLQIIPRRNPALPCQLSLSQERLWFMEQLNPEIPVYNEAEAVLMKGSLDLELLERALNDVVSRHEILRATIGLDDERPIVIVHDTWPMEFRKIDLRHLSSPEREPELARLLVDEPRRPYNLAKQPGIRAAVLQLTDRENAFILMMHHVICDRLSVGILWRELGMLYTSAARKEASTLAPLQIQYGDYSAWQQLPERRIRFTDDLRFWKDYLRNLPKLLDLPSDRPRPSVNTYNGKKLQFFLGTELSDHLRRLARQEQTSLFNVVAAGLNTLLFRYTGQEDIPVGVPIADRDRSELQPLIGFLLDTHVLRTDLSGNPTFRELLTRVHHTMLRVYSHQAVPFNEVVDALQPERSLSYSPLFQILLNWREATAELQFIGFPGVVVEPLLAQANISKFDLTLFVTDTSDDLLLEIEFNTDLFDEDRIERMIGHFRTLLRGAVEDPERSLAELPLLTPAEQHQLLFEWNSASESGAEHDTFAV